METFKARDLKQAFNSGQICYSDTCTHSGCNREYVLLKDAETECKTQWDISNTLRGKLADANAETREANEVLNVVVRSQRNRESLLKSEKGFVVDDNKRLRELLDNANKVIKERGVEIDTLKGVIDRKDEAGTDLRTRLNAAEESIKQMKLTQYAALYGGRTVGTEFDQRHYRTVDGKNYRANSKDEVFVPVRDLLALEDKIDNLKAELSGKLSRDNARDVMYVAGWRWQELVTAEGGLKELLVRHEAYGSSLRGEIKVKNDFIEMQGKTISVQAKEINRLSKALLEPRSFEISLHATMMKIAGVLGVKEGEDILLVAEEVARDRNYMRGDTRYSTISAISKIVGKEGAPYLQVVAAVQEMREHRDSYKHILKCVREALGMQAVSTGHQVIARANELVSRVNELNTAYRVIRDELHENRAVLRHHVETRDRLQAKLQTLSKIVDREQPSGTSHSIGMALRLDDMRRVLQSPLPTTGAVGSHS